MGTRPTVEKIRRLCYITLPLGDGVFQNLSLTNPLQKSPYLACFGHFVCLGPIVRSMS